MEKKKYYAITTSMTFEKTVLVPTDSVKDIDEAIDLVDCGVKVALIDLLNEKADCETKQSPWADKNGIYELSDSEAELYQIIGREGMDYKIENIIEITRLVVEHMCDKDIDCNSFPYTELKDYITELAEKFEAIHTDSDWNELDYNEEITRFTNKALAKELWQRFGDVPMDPDTEEIEKEWNGFPAGTWREDIWHWFEETFNVSVAKDLMGMEDEDNCSLGIYDCATCNANKCCLRQNDLD